LTRINNSPRISRIGVIGALLISFLSGCTPRIEKLEIVRIGKLRVDSITREMITLRAELVVRNPYSSSARLKDIRFDLSITDHSIAYGRLTGSTELKSGSTATLDVPVAVPCNQITELDLEALFSKSIPYQIDGSAVLEKPFGPRTLPIHIRNRMERPDELQLLLSHQSAFEVISPDASATSQLATLIRQQQLAMRFYNPLPFPLNIDGFEYEVRLGSESVVNGEAKSRIRLEPGKNRFAVSVRPHALGAAGELLDLLISKSIPDLALATNFYLARGERPLKVHLVYSPKN